jgi:hypothetical protein
VHTHSRRTREREIVCTLPMVDVHSRVAVVGALGEEIVCSAGAVRVQCSFNDEAVQRSASKQAKLIFISSISAQPRQRPTRSAKLKGRQRSTVR